jgi:hypothetical protein
MKKVTAWRPDRANSWVEFCLRWALGSGRCLYHEVPKAEEGASGGSRIISTAPVTDVPWR